MPALGSTTWLSQRKRPRTRNALLLAASASSSSPPPLHELLKQELRHLEEKGIERNGGEHRGVWMKDGKHWWQHTGDTHRFSARALQKGIPRTAQSPSISLAP